MSAPKVEQFVATALLRIRNTEDFSHLKTWLQTWSEVETKSCVHQQGEMVYRAQGRAQVLLELLEEIEKSNATAAKLSGR